VRVEARAYKGHHPLIAMSAQYGVTPDKASSYPILRAASPAEDNKLFVGVGPGRVDLNAQPDPSCHHIGCPPSRPVAFVFVTL
jgi:hypothetical protein